MTSTIMKDILNQADNVASSHTAIIIVGEYGSGRSWLAKRIHQRGNRSGKPFLSVNCRIIEVPDALKKIFGFLVRSGTGTRICRGVLEQCQGGTVFFENFDGLPKDLQKKVLETSEVPKITRIGSSQVVEIDQPRIICSIEIKPSHLLHQEDFLNDTILNHNPYIIGQPSLRQRREDIAPFIHMFLDQQFRNRPKVSAKKASPETIYLCIKYDWPGNVRQLKNAIEHAAITSEHSIIQPEDLPISIKSDQSVTGRIKHPEKNYSFLNAEKDLIKSVLSKTGSTEEAAELLGLEHTTFLAKAEKHKLQPESRRLELEHQDLKS